MLADQCYFGVFIGEFISSKNIILLFAIKEFVNGKDKIE